MGNRLTKSRRHKRTTAAKQNGIFETTVVTHETVLKNQRHSWVQLAGHPDSFVRGCRRTGTVCKKQVKREWSEAQTYQALMEDPLCPAIPKFYREFEQNDEVYIEIEDLLHQFTDPNVMDIKMGTRTFQESEAKNMELRRDLYNKMVSVDASEPTSKEHEQKSITKLRYMQFRERGSTSACLGFRIDAVRLSGESCANTNMKLISTEEAVACTLLSLFGGRQCVWEKLLCRLNDIRCRFETSPFFKHHEIIGSSLLIICDDVHVGAWMIDFAKILHVPDRLITHRDPWQLGNHEDGYLIGIDNLIKIISSILREQHNCNFCGSTGSAAATEHCVIYKSEFPRNS